MSPWLAVIGIVLAGLSLLIASTTSWLVYAGHRDRKVAGFKDVVAAEAESLARRGDLARRDLILANPLRMPRVPRQPAGWLKRRALQLRRLYRRLLKGEHQWLAEIVQHDDDTFEALVRLQPLQHFRGVVLLRSGDHSFNVLLEWLSGTSKLTVVNRVLTKRGHPTLDDLGGSEGQATLLPMGSGEYLFIEPALRRHRRPHRGARDQRP